MMDTTFWLLLALALTMVGVTWHAHRIGNEPRDVKLLGAIAALLCTGTAVAALL
jgi:hypothetical protein